MTDFTYSGPDQPGRLFIEGPFGAGKTTYALTTLSNWLEAGVPPEKILVIIPQRSLAKRYLNALRFASLGPLGDVEIRTVGGLAQEAALLYWPLVAREMGFAHPEREPHLLTIETSQYAMSSFVEQALLEGEFSAINISPQQIARQIIDNLGKAAILGIASERVPELLKSAWGNDRPLKRKLVYEAAGRVAQHYRAYCLERNLLDYALQIEIYTRLIKDPRISKEIFNKKTHLIIEHLEEESPFTHDLLKAWLPYLTQSTMTYEWDGGFRVFLGADPEGGYQLKKLCDGQLTLKENKVSSPFISDLTKAVSAFFKRGGRAPALTTLPVWTDPKRFIPEMVDWTVMEIAHLLEAGVRPRDIAILAPFLSDSLQFSLVISCTERGIPVVTHRPSRALRDESATKTILTLLMTTFPEWGSIPPASDLSAALHQAIEGLDPVRAALLTKIIYRDRAETKLAPFSGITEPEMQERITFTLGERYDQLREWLLAQRDAPPTPLDHLISRLYGEVLSQPGFGFHDDYQAGRVTAELIESARKFRLALYPDGVDSDRTFTRLSSRYLAIIEQGLLAALYVTSWQDEEADAILIAPAYTFLMRNRSVKYQFWLNAGSDGWWERLDQPLSQPYVLSPHWPEGRVWSDTDEYEKQEEMLHKIIVGLLRRCEEGVYLGISEFSEQGYEQRGPMLRLFQSLFRKQERGLTPESEGG